MTAPYAHTFTPADDVVSHLNYTAELTAAVIGDELGPDDAGRMWRIADIGPRIDGKPGTRVKVWHRPKQFTLEATS